MAGRWRRGIPMAAAHWTPRPVSSVTSTIVARRGRVLLPSLLLSRAGCKCPAVLMMLRWACTTDLEGGRMAGAEGDTSAQGELKLDAKQARYHILSTWCIHKYQYIHYFNLTLGDLLKVVEKALKYVMSLHMQANSSIAMLGKEEKPDVSYSDIGGMDLQKQEIHEIGIDLSHGVLLYGPPGALLPSLGKIASAIIFIDEIDAIATKRFYTQTGADREVQYILLELLNQMDGQVIMATNRTDTFDAALLHPGQLDRKIDLPLPSRHEKCLIFQAVTSKMNLGPDVDLNDCSWTSMSG
ncbi:P-loop containing nucleoside triphosphate hydrolase protein [Suillus subluteus]|nr:P-loop containing nucleoside triphosphate hydrolase protein [Suillus subluteus]